MYNIYFQLFFSFQPGVCTLYPVSLENLDDELSSFLLCQRTPQKCKPSQKQIICLFLDLARNLCFFVPATNRIRKPELKRCQRHNGPRNCIPYFSYLIYWKFTCVNQMQIVAHWHIAHCTFCHKVGPIALDSNLSIRWRCLDWLKFWSPGGATCIATLPRITLLSSSAGVQLISSSARVASVKSANGVVWTDIRTHRSDPRDTWVR